MMNKPSISRRDFLKLTLDSLLVFGGLLGLGGLIRFLSYKTEPPQQTEFDLGLAQKGSISQQYIAGTLYELGRVNHGRFDGYRRDLGCSPPSMAFSGSPDDFYSAGNLAASQNMAGHQEGMGLYQATVYQ